LSRAAAGSALFFLVAPCVVAGVVPWLITGWDAEEPLEPWLPARLLGAVLAAAGATVLLHAFARFVSEGLGTPAPVAPTERLVVGGLYRYVRNPMYLAVVGVIVGQALLLGRWELVAYAAAVAAAFAAFVHRYEEPTLERRYGAEYTDYRRSVPAWIPRKPTRP
jgi:protein-S-isoprenylcysteine O-methyltransferase Ste14